jgi:hypothetical protein
MVNALLYDTIVKLCNRFLLLLICPLQLIQFLNNNFNTLLKPYILINNYYSNCNLGKNCQLHTFHVVS